MSILGWILIGLIAGFLAGVVTGTRKKLGCLLYPVVGIVGAFVGGFIFSYLQGEEVSFAFNWWSLFVAFVGASVLLLVARILAWIIGGRKRQ